MSLPTPSPPLPRPPPWLIEGGAAGHEAAWLLGWPQSLSGPPGAQARALGQPAMRACVRAGVATPGSSHPGLGRAGEKASGTAQLPSEAHAQGL